MGKSSVLSAVLLLCTVLMHTDAEQEYFTLSTNLTWEEARSHCQMCFSDLVTLTPFNIRNISQRISSAHWIGLRKYFNSTGNGTTGNGTTNSSVPWTQWADGAPLVFQNWYPGWPVFKSPLPKIECCSCSCTCPARVSPTSAPTRGYTESPDSNNTDASTTDAILRHGPSESPAGYRITDPTDATTPDAPDTTQSHWVSTPPTPIASTCERSPMLPPIVPEELQNYVEDSCVAMLSFGPWVERDCSDPLPFICYEDRFYGEVNVSGITATSASVAWQRGPDGISHYRLHVVGGNETWVQNLTELSRDLDRLTPGTGYSVEVFAVKCGRDLNPQTTIFYTTPEEVQDLNVVKVTERSVTLNWTEPEGQFDFFLVKSPSDDVEVTTEEAEVKNLMPGGCFTFSVLTGVQDRSRWSEASPIAACTKPEKVSDLKVSDNTNMSLVLSWTPPEGNFTGFQVVALSVNKTLLFNETRGRGETSAVVTGLPNGSEIRLFVTALGRDGLRGDTVSDVDFTAPGPISHLVVVTKDTSLNADWKPAEGGPLTFTTELLWEKTVVKTKDVVNETSVMFDTLNTTTEYTVVWLLLLETLLPKMSKWTPSPYTGAPPPNVTKATYLVEVRSGFWNESFQSETQKTTFTFDRLRSGTNYTCEVMTQAGDDKSPPVNLTEMTVADKVEIGLSMMCSSADSLQCENETKVMKEIHDYLESNLKEHIFWKFN
ncbi:unnamed protein product [Menidia menidia]|uniref:(Atlantic silverside) hypothetical protein n=1 Tax=Menidia menidia TaxID=238744 RepID=A0A8S4BFR1_9TELE|nr:unnamed protein product [Menidia menidia]